MDVIDLTEQNTELFQRIAINKSKRFEPDAKPTGECLYCGDKIENGRRWCDAECRDGWEHENDRDYEF